MKKMFLIMMIVGGLAMSCRTNKETVANTDTTENTGKEQPVDGGVDLPIVEGIVKMSPECGAYVRVTKGDVMISYLVVNLPDKYRSEGLRLRFSYEDVMAKLPAGCEFLKPVSASNLEEIK
jgi:hypothetical protein